MSPDPDEDRHGRLLHDLKIIRRRGVGGVKAREISTLWELSTTLVEGEPVSDERCLEQVLNLAIARLDDNPGTAAGYLLGVVQVTRGQRLDIRRQRAADVFHQTGGAFKKRENGILSDLAAELLVLESEVSLTQPEEGQADAQDRKSDAQLLAEEVVHNTGAGPQGGEGGGRHTRRLRTYVAIAGVAALISCTFAALDIAQVGPFGKPEILIYAPKDQAGPKTANSHATTCKKPLPGAPTTRSFLLVLTSVEPIDGVCAWTQNLSVEMPGTALKYLITYKNLSNSVQRNVAVGVNLAPRLVIVPGTTTIFNSNNPQGVFDPSNNIASGGVNVGNYSPGAGGYVEFLVTSPETAALACEWTNFRTVGVVQPRGFDQYYNTAIVNVFRSC